MGGELSVKPVRAITWTDVGGREASLIQRCAARDEDACAELVSEHQRMVYQLSLNLLNDHNEALDLSQEVFLRVFRTIHSFRGHSASAPGSTASSSTRRATGSAGGGGATARSRCRSISTSRITAICRKRSIAGRTGWSGRSSSAERIRVALDRLPFDQKTAIVLREIDGLSYDEIGFSLGIAVGTVKSRLARAREGLRAQLRDV